MKITILHVLAVLLWTGCADKTESGSTKQVGAEVPAEVIEELKIENLLRDSLELTGSVEVIMSYLEVPKHTTLPTHYHPGEEFAYLIEGSGELILEDQSKMMIKAGEVAKVPFKHVHSFSTLDEPAKIVVFRVHEKGQPDRILVE
ncbi:cupin domain-containing protein [Rapidithrix thailandica]|uniref:Cupin domain-containing protein n=1 Tax=Rapidithrix thailandica TaxID=413964 RepID=A0AAW9S567_9BACT